MKTGRRLAGTLVLAVICLAAFSDAWGQFTQGPPGNPSAVGITTGSPPPLPVSPHVISPAPSPVSPSMGTADPFGSFYPAPPTGTDLVNSPRLMLSLAGLPPLLDNGERTRLASYLVLSPEQIARMRSLTDSFYRETRNLRYELLRDRIDMRRLFADPRTERSVLLVKQKELSGRWSQLMDALAETVLTARENLTSEQIEKLDRLGTD